MNDTPYQLTYSLNGEEIVIRQMKSSKYLEQALKDAIIVIRSENEQDDNIVKNMCAISLLKLE